MQRNNELRMAMVRRGQIVPALNGKPAKRWGWSKERLWNAGFPIAATGRVPEIDAENIGYIQIFR